MEPSGRQRRPLRVAVYGAAGRMGRALIHELAAADDLALAHAVVRRDSPVLGKDAGELAGAGALGVACATRAGPADVAIEFTARGGFEAVLSACLDTSTPLVSGSTGLDGPQLHALAVAAERLAILWAPNMSLGVALLHRLVALAAARLGDGADIEVLETHHRHKRDAPSGTALALAETAACARGQDPAATLRLNRHGAEAERRDGEIGVTGLRAGDVAGEHTVLFGLTGERLELTHRAAGRAVFVRGALAAARFLAGRPPGRYGLDDVLGDASVGPPDPPCA